MMSSLTNNSTVIFNCGGKIFEIKTDTIMSFPDSMLARRINSKLDTTDNFIDRSYELFELVLEYYRKHVVYIPYNIQYSQIIEEFKFYGFDVVNMDVRFHNINDCWKQSNNKIKNVENLIDKLVISNFFQKQFQDKITIHWIIFKSLDNYIVFKNGFICQTVVKEYFKRKYNLLANWIESDWIVKEINDLVNTNQYAITNEGKEISVPVKESADIRGIITIRLNY